MAFGQPGKTAAVIYVGIASIGLAVLLVADPLWARVLGAVAISYSLCCLFLTGAFLEFFSAIPADRAARDGRQATGRPDVPGDGDSTFPEGDSATGRRYPSRGRR